MPIPGANLYNGFLEGLKWIIGQHAIIYAILGILVLFAQSLYVRSIAVRHRILANQGYLPSFVFLVLSSLHPALSSFSMALWLNWLLLGGIDLILQLSKTNDRRILLFNIGFLFALCSLWHSSALIFFGFMLLALLVMRPIRLQEITITLIGFGFPFYIAFCLLYLFNHIQVASSWLHFSVQLPTHFSPWFYLPLILLVVFCLVVAGLIWLSQNFSRLPVTVRRAWQIILIALFTSSLTALVSPGNAVSVWLITLPFLAMLIAPALTSEKRSSFANFTVYFLIIFVFYCQLLLPT